MDEEPDSPKSLDIHDLLHQCELELHSPDVETRRKAVKALYMYCYENPSCSAAVPLLSQLIYDPDEKIGESASWGLKYCAPHSIEPLIMCLSSLDELVRYRACDALGHIGDAAVLASDSLRALLQDAAPKIRSRSAWALGLIHDTQQRTLDALFTLLDSELSSDRSSALHALGNIGKALPDPLPLRSKQQKILGFLQAASEDERCSACHAIESLGLPDKEYAQLLMSVLTRDDSEEVRRRAIEALRELATRFDLLPYVDVFCKTLDKKGTAAWDLCKILGDMGTRAKVAVPVLTGLLDEEDGYLAIAATKALWNIDPRADEILPALARLFPDYGESVCDAICVIGAKAAPLAPKVIEALETENWDLQWAAADALGAIASADPSVIALLIGTLNHDSPIVKSAVTRALVNTGTPAVAPMLDVLKNFNDPRCEWIADTLARMGHTAMESVDTLRGAYNSPDNALKAWAAVALGSIAGDPAVVPTLIQWIRAENNAYLRVRVAQALAAIGPAAATALSELEHALDDDDEDVRVAAQDAISAISRRSH